jgi:hypothetical protein
MGFYAPLVGVIFPMAFVIVGVGNIALWQRWNFFPLFTLALAAVAGTLLSFALNYHLTGVPDITPIGIFWAISDHAKAAQVLGLGGIEYFLRTNNDVHSSSGAEQPWRFLRFPIPIKFLAASIAAGLVLAWIERKDRLPHSTIAIGVRLAAFVLPLMILAVAFQSSAVVYRAGLNSIVFTVIGAIMVWKRLIDRIPRVGSVSRLSMIRIASAAVIFGAVAFAFVTTVQLTGREAIGLAWRDAAGIMSLKSVITAMEPHIRRDTVGVEPTLGVTEMEYIQSHIAPKRIMRLTYESGYSNSLPGAGILSEPTYSLADDPAKLRAASPVEVAAYLKQRNIAYFIINLRAPLFSSIAFTKLFDPVIVAESLKVAYRNGDIFVLTWNDGDGMQPPPSLLEGLDFKRSAALHIPFTDEFARPILEQPDRTIFSFAEFKREIEEFEKAMERGRLALEERLSLNASRGTLRAVFAQAMKDAGKVGTGDPIETGCWSRRCKAGLEDPEIMKPFKASTLRRALINRFHGALRHQYREAFGALLASVFESTNELEPFGPTETATAK